MLLIFNVSNMVANWRLIMENLSWQAVMISLPRSLSPLLCVNEFCVNGGLLWSLCVCMCMCMSTSVFLLFTSGIPSILEVLRILQGEKKRKESSSVFPQPCMNSYLVDRNISPILGHSFALVPYCNMVYLEN